MPNEKYIEIEISTTMAGDLYRTKIRLPERTIISADMNVKELLLYSTKKLIYRLENDLGTLTQ